MIDNQPFSLCPIEQGCRLCLIWNNLILLDDSRLLLACYSSTVMASPMEWMRRITRLVSFWLRINTDSTSGRGPGRCLWDGNRLYLVLVCAISGRSFADTASIAIIRRHFTRRRSACLYGAAPGQCAASPLASCSCYSAVSSRRAMAFS